MSTDDDLERLLRDSLALPVDGPPPDRVAALRAAAEARRSAAPVPIPSPPRRGRWPVPVAIAAAAAALVVAFAVGRQTAPSGPPDDEVAGVVEFDGTLEAPDGGGSASARVVETGIGRVITFDTQALPILPTGEYYELWFVGAEDSEAAPQRISAGTFHPDPDGRSQVTFAAAVNPAEFPVLSVTAEPDDGDPAATGPEVLRGDLAS